MLACHLCEEGKYWNRVATTETNFHVFSEVGKKYLIFLLYKE